MVVSKMPFLPASKRGINTNFPSIFATVPPYKPFKNKIRKKSNLYLPPSTNLYRNKTLTVPAKNIRLPLHCTSSFTQSRSGMSDSVAGTSLLGPGTTEDAPTVAMGPRSIRILFTCKYRDFGVFGAHCDGTC